MKRHNLHTPLGRLFVVLLLLLVATVSQAQVTSSALSGRVIDDLGEEAIGASVIAVHEPSGTRYQAITNTEGRFAIQGMRNGGPYTVSISYIGFATKVYHDITLRLGDTYALDVSLKESAKELAEVVVTGKASKLIGEQMGIGVNINAETISNLPTPNHSLDDVIRLSPYANGLGVAGGDARMTNFKLDGANLNNSMGLTSTLPGGGAPVPLASIDEMQIVVAPFDVRQANFVSGGINAVTKSGTNTLKGTAYVFYNNEEMHGNRVNKEELTDRSDEQQTTFGATLGGPIVRNKLFFFLNYEGTRTPVSTPHPVIDGMSDLQQFVLSRYGYDAGSLTDYPNGVVNNKFLARLDWNIHLDHHLTFRFNHTSNRRWNSPNASETDASTRLTTPRMAYFSNSMYLRHDRVTTFSLDLHSRFGQQLSNQFLATYSDMRDTRDSDSEPFPFVDIMAAYNAETQMQTLVPYASLGYELFSWNNAVKSGVLTLTDNLTYNAGNHKLTAGMSWEHQNNRNYYMRNGLGYYRYRSLNDFMNGADPETVALTYGYDGNDNPMTRVRYNQFGLYLQDEWNITPKVKLSMGVRADKVSLGDSDVMRNNLIYGLDFGGRHIDTGRWPDMGVQLTPRMGILWDVRGDKTLRVRGGTGLFAGRMPMVYLTNMAMYSAMTQNTAIATTTYNGNQVTAVDERLASFGGGLVTDPKRMLELLRAPATLNVDRGMVPGDFVGIDPDFKMPQVWKSVIAVDYQVPVAFPLKVTGELSYTRYLHDITIENYNMRNPDDSWQQFKGADNRWIYPTDSRYMPMYTTIYGNVLSYSYNACVLTNTNRGHGWTANLTLNADPLKGVHLIASYTHTVLKQVNSMTGANPTTLWSGQPSVNGVNVGEIGSGASVCPDRVIANLSWRTGPHQLSLFYAGFRPGAYSYMYANDLNGDGIANDLLYIPRDDSEIRFATDADRQAFWAFVEQDDYLNSHRGQYAEAYAVHAPWVHKFDFHWAYNIKLHFGKTKHLLQLLVDVENISNFFNSSWGVIQTNNSRILSVRSIDAGVPTFTFALPPNAQSFSYLHNSSQCWKVQIGLRYNFN